MRRRLKNKIMKHQVIKHYEGLHDGDLSKIGLQPKMDPSGIWTEGWGHAIHQNGKFIRGASNKALAYKLAIVKTEAEDQHAGTREEKL